MYKRIVKRSIDFTSEILGLLVLSPILIFDTLVYFIAKKCNPFFFQTRPGKMRKYLRSSSSK